MGHCKRRLLSDENPGADMYKHRFYMIFLLLQAMCRLKHVNTNDFASCKDSHVNNRMTGKVLKTVHAYTALQCQDICLRSSACDGINFKLDRSKKQYLLCQLVQTNTSSRLIHNGNWVYKKLNRTSVKNLWVSAF